MTSGINKLTAVRLLGIGVIVVASLVSPEASAQGGRAEASRRASSTSVSRGDARGKAEVQQRRSPAQRKVVERRDSRKKQKAAPPLAQRGDRSGRVSKGNRSGRSDSGRTRVENRSDRRGSREAFATRDRHAGDRSRYEGDRRHEDDRRKRKQRATDKKHRRDNDRYDRHRSHDRYYRHDRHDRHDRHYPRHHKHHRRKHFGAHVHIGSHLYFGISWPWKVRYHRHWAPRYRYRQVVYVDAGWGHRHRRSRVDVRTYYRHHIRHADDNYAEVDIEIDAIELYEDGRYLGTVDQIPGSLRKIRATIYADGRIAFDRNVFLVGDRYSGFEMISTRYYDDHLHNSYRPGHGYKAGRLELGRGRVKKIRHSRLFDPYSFDGYVPISLLPDDDRLWDYGSSYLSDRRYDDGYGNDWYRHYRDREGYRYDGDDYELSRDLSVSYQTPQGAEISVRRSTVLDRF